LQATATLNQRSQASYVIALPTVFLPYLWIFEDDVTLSTLLDEVGQSRTPVPTEQVAGGDRELDNVVDRLLHDSICWVACLGFEI
jgi:hypothetical protein